MSSTPWVRHSVDMLLCDAHGVYVRGWITAGDGPVAKLELCSGDASTELVDRIPRPDLLLHFPTLSSDLCGFGGYLACAPFRPLTLRALTDEGWVEIDVGGKNAWAGDPPAPDINIDIGATPQPGNEDAALVKAADLFDAEWYLKENPDVAAAGMDPAEHYVLYGGFEGRDPGPNFSSTFYLGTNGDVLRAGMNPLVHYMRYGSEEGRDPKNTHDKWIAAYDALDERDERAIALHISRLPYRPLFSIILPVFNPDPDHLTKAIESVRRQHYPHWELCIADDCSTSSEIAERLRRSAAEDTRIKLVMREVNGNICAASNSALALAAGDFVCLLDHDDELHPTALYELAVKLDAHPDADIIYTDCDQITEHGDRFNPYFKTGWNYDLLLGHNLVGHLDAYRRTLITEIGGFQIGYEGSQDYDLSLRAIDASDRARIHHVPAICYHWRRDSRGISFSDRAQEACIAVARRAIGDHLARRGVAALVEPNPKVPSFNRIVWPLPSPAPAITVAVIHSHGSTGLAESVASVMALGYEPLQLIVTAPAELAGAVADASGDYATVLPIADGVLAAERKTRAVQASTGEVVIFLAAGASLGGSETLRELVSQALRSDIGLAAPFVIDDEGIIREAGIVLNSSNDSPLVSRANTGRFGLFALVRDVSAVGMDCVAIRRELYTLAGGLRADIEPRQSAVAFAARLRSLGYRSIVTPFAECIRPRSAFIDYPRGAPEPGEDPLYSPHLSLEGLFAAHAIPSRRILPWAEYKTEVEIREGQAHRAQILLDGLPKTARIVEVGASYSPIAPRSEGWNTTIIDHADRAELVAKYSGQEHIWTERIEEVDHIWQSGSLRDAVPADQLGTYDALLSSHSIEHMPDVIGFLKAAADILRDDGTFILAVPDKRYCFDYFRQVSTTPQLLEAHETNRSRHPRRVGADHWCYTVTNDGVGAWGQDRISKLAFAGDFDAGMRGANELNDRDDAPYQDFHAWIFTPASFELILLELARLGIIDWRVERRASEIGCEFHMRLRRGGRAEVQALTAEAFQARRLELLREGLMETVTQARYLGLLDETPPAPPPEPSPPAAASIPSEDVAPSPETGPVHDIGPGPAVVGYIDSFIGQDIIGWAWDPQATSEPTMVEFLVDDTVIHVAEASDYRPDVAAAGIGPGSGRVGFRTQLPLRDRARPVQVRVRESGRQLANSPMVDEYGKIIDRWLNRRNRVTGEFLARLRRRFDDRVGDRTLSIVMPVYNGREDWLREALDSVLDQWCSRWELICVDDGSTAPHVPVVLAEYAKRDPRIRIVHLPENKGTAKAVNAGIAPAAGDYVTFLDHDGVIEPDAVYHLLRAAAAGADLIYSDEVLTRENSAELIDFQLRPAFNWHHYLSHPYFVHLVCVRTALARTVGGWDVSMAISADVDFVLRIVEVADRICHVPAVLYRWRTHPGSAGHMLTDKVAPATLDALNRHLDRVSPGAHAYDSDMFNQYRVEFPDDRGRMLIVIPTRDRIDLLKRCIESIRATTPADEFHICVVDHESQEAETVSYLQSLRETCTIVPFAGTFNYGRMNNIAVRACLSGGFADVRYLCLMNNDIEVLEAGSLQRLRTLAAQPDIGAVGATLAYEDGTTQHCGVILGQNGMADHAHRLEPIRTADGGRWRGYLSALVSLRQCSAVTAACLMMRMESFQRVGGFDESFEIGFNDTDLCLRLADLGLKIVNDGSTVLLHRESVTRRQTGQIHHAEDDRRFGERWAEKLAAGDPFHHPLLSYPDNAIRSDWLSRAPWPLRMVLNDRRVAAKHENEAEPILEIAHGV